MSNKVIPYKDITGIALFRLPKTNKLFPGSGLLLNRSIIIQNAGDVLHSIDTYRKQYNYNKVYFTDIGETFDSSYLDFINPICDRLLNDFKIDINDLQYVCGAWPVLENFKLYEKHCETNNYIKLPMTMVNSYEIKMKQYLDASKFLLETNMTTERPKLFLCFNGKARPHRLGLLSYLITNDLLENSYFSLYATESAINMAKYYAGRQQERLVDFKTMLEIFKSSGVELPMSLSYSSGSYALSSNCHKISRNDLDFFMNSYFSVITETSFFKKDSHKEGDFYNSHLDSTFITEKTFRSIACKHPFIIMSRPKTLYHLRKMGYKTFGHVIDESYDDIQDDGTRFFAIVEEIKRLCTRNKNYWKTFIEDTKEIVEYNYQRLRSSTLLSFNNDDMNRQVVVSGI